jgi:putative transposase
MPKQKSGWPIRLRRDSYCRSCESRSPHTALTLTEPSLFTLSVRVAHPLAVGFSPHYLIPLPKLRHYDRLGTARFVTFSCYHRYQLLTSPDDIRVVIRHLSLGCEKHAVHILGYVVMPEHVHFVLHPPDAVSLGKIIGEIKSRSAREILTSWKKQSDRRLSLLIKPLSTSEYRFWQPRCYDHNCRTPATVREKIEYCHNNPVKRGLVSRPSDWRWSSYGCYHGAENVELEMDGHDL